MWLAKTKKKPFKAFLKAKRITLDLYISIAIFNAKVCEVTHTESSRKESIIQILYPAKWLYKYKGTNTVEIEGV